MNLTKKILPGEYYKGKINSIIPIGAFVELLPGKDGMVHISQFPVRIPAIEAVVKVGDEVLVKVVDVDDRGRINLTMRGVTDEQRAEFGLEPFVIPDNLDEYVAPPPPPRREGGYNNRGGGDRGGSRGGGRY